jgi:hypothetical protein
VAKSSGIFLTTEIYIFPSFMVNRTKYLARELLAHGLLYEAEVSGMGSEAPPALEDIHTILI